MLLLLLSALSGLPDFCHLDGLQWSAHQSKGGTGSGKLHKGGGDGGCDLVQMESLDGPMSGAFVSSSFPVEALKGYTVSMDVKTENLVPTKNEASCIEAHSGDQSGTHIACTGAYLTGGAYVSYEDSEGRADGWFPAYGEHAPSTSPDYRRTNMSFSPPTTAVRARLYLAFAAHSYAYEPNRMEGGTATGTVWIKNVKMRLSGTSAVVARPTISLPRTADTHNITSALTLATQCLHNSQLSGNFTVGSDYDISGNLSPDIAFGLLGARRMAYPPYMRVFERMWGANRALIGADGKFGRFQRVMAQLLWPLGVDALFSFSGNTSFLRDNMPYVDRSLDFLASISAADDQFPCFSKSFIADYPPGVDWNDWQPSRAYGATVNFQTWYARTLRRFSALHQEFSGSGSFGDRARAERYAELADNVTANARRLLWRGDHFATNARWTESCAPRVEDDGVWVDDQLWAVAYSLANRTQAAAVWAWLDARPDYEGVPTRWSSKQGSARYSETWFGRLGLADVLMRYRSTANPTGKTEPARGQQLLERIASAFVRSKNVYESYTMSGEVGGDRGTDYLEHCGGYLWALLDGPFGVDFDSDAAARWAATIAPQLPASWAGTMEAPATASFYLRGVLVRMKATTSTAGKGAVSVSVSGEGGVAPVKVRLVSADGSTRVVELGGPSSSPPTAAEEELI